jgi:hypothetical protein
MSARRSVSTGLASLCVVAGAWLSVSAQALAASAPVLGEESALNVSGDSATLQAEVNPEGSATTYRFEYGTSEAYGLSAPTPEGIAGAGTGMVGVEAHVQGLQPGTTYHFRVVASSAGGVGPGADGSFTTQRIGGEFALPDGRQWEMVTPLQKEGALFFGPGLFEDPELAIIQAAAGGSAIADLASQPTEAEPQGYATPVSVLSTRGSGGWSSQVIAPPRNVVSGPGQGTEYRMFSEDLSRGVVQPFRQFEPLSPEVSESTPYLHTDYFNGNVGEHCQTGCFLPLVTRANDTASPFQPFGEAGCEYFFCGPMFVGASADLSHVIVHSTAQLTSAPVHTFNGGLYEWFGGHLQLVSVFPPGENPEGVNSAVGLAGGYSNPGGSQTEGVRRTVSENGERVIFATDEGTAKPGGLYLRDVAKGETVLLPGSHGSHYMTASKDTSRVFFRNGGNLEVFEVTSGASEPLAGRATDLTVDPHAGESADVIAVLGASDDGSYVYFAAGGALTPNAVPGTCQGEEIGAGEKATEGCNLYVSHDGVTSLVAAGWIEGGGGGFPVSSREWSRVSPDGRWFAFMSTKSPTGYDNRDALSGHPDAEVYLYDASTGRLVCASCDPTGARPVGVNTSNAQPVPWVAGNVPAWMYSRDSLYAPLYQPRYLSDSGRLFFESHGALVPQDVNRTQDVYEYEPEGVPAGGRACSPSSASGSEVYKPARAFEVEGHRGEEGAGCLALISSGTSSEESSFLDASESGGDVFFLTESKLAAQDFDQTLDVYDAHECTSVSPCPAQVQEPPPCDTESSCRAAPTPQPSIYGAPSSATFSGAGNLTPVPAPIVKPKSRKSAKCKHGFVKRHKKCVRVRSSAKKTSAGKGRK